MSKENLKNKFHTSHFALHTSSKGITLIALIITIIVMLVLTGVTISVILGDNGLVNKAKEAKIQMEIEQDKELLLSAVAGSIGIDGKVDFTYLDSHLPAGFTGSNGNYTSKNGYAFSVSENGDVIYIGKGTNDGNEGNEGVEGEISDLELLRTYFLGEIDETTGERPGKQAFSLMANPEIMGNADFSYTDIRVMNNDVISDAYDTVRIIGVEEGSIVTLLISYNGNIYEAKMNAEDNTNIYFFLVDLLDIAETTEVAGIYHVLSNDGINGYNQEIYIELCDDGTYIRTDWREKGKYLVNKSSQEIMFFREYKIDSTLEIIEEYESDGSYDACAYDIIYENDKVSNIVIHTIGKDSRYFIGWKNELGVEHELEGAYVYRGEEYSQLIYFIPGDLCIYSNEYPYWQGYAPDYDYNYIYIDSVNISAYGYIKYKGQYYTEEEFVPMTVSDDLSKITIGDKEYNKEDITFEKINYSMLEVGDKITGYAPTSYTSSNPYTVSLPGCSGSFYPENFTWEVTLVSGNTITMKPNGVTSNQLSLTGANGWNNSLKALDDVCSQVYGISTSKYTAIARSVTFEEAAGTSGTPTSSSYPASSYGSNNKFPTEYLREYHGLTDVLEDSTGCGYASNANITITNTSFTVSNQSLQGKGNYWAAKRCVIATSSDKASFSVGHVGSTTEATLFDTTGTEYTVSKAIKPVVTLTINDTSCLTSEDGDNWTISNE